MKQLLLNLPANHREMLLRYYVGGQSAESIELTFGLSSEEFQALRAETRQRFAEMCRDRGLVSSKPPTAPWTDGL
jgi:DNA-directed RNA polymerase specialized sigma24 family protein